MEGKTYKLCLAKHYSQLNEWGKKCKEWNPQIL